MENQFCVIDNYLMIKMPEEIDHYKSGYICKNADEFILKKEVSHIVFDFEDTRFMDSSGIGIILGRYKKITLFGGKVYLINANEQIKRILLVSGMNKIVEIKEK